MRKFYFLNAIVPPKGAGGLLISSPYSWKDVRELVYASKIHSPEVEIVYAVGHQATAELLGIPCFRNEVFPEAGDVALVARLKKRATGDVSDLTHEDLEFRIVLYGPATCDNPHCLMNDPYHPSSFVRIFK